MHLHIHLVLSHILNVLRKPIVPVIVYIDCNLARKSEHAELDANVRLGNNKLHFVTKVFLDNCIKHVQNEWLVSI